MNYPGLALCVIQLNAGTMDFCIRATTILLILFPLKASAQLIFEDVTQSHGFEVTVPGDAHGSGIAMADYDNDGDADIYLCSERNSIDQLYRNDNGNFILLENNTGLGSTERSRMALWIDIDGDRYLDLLVAGDCDFDEQDCPDASHIRLYHQDAGIFNEISTEAGLDEFGPKKKDQVVGGMAAADINLDGYMDFVIAIRNGSLQVFLNQRNNTFEMRTLELGMSLDNTKYYQPMFHDFNQDGLADLYCNVDFGENTFWISEANGSYKEGAQQSNSDNAFNEMGISLGDFDNDGDFDIYSTNIYSYLGQDVHNILLRNDGTSENLSFTEVSETLGVESAGWGWGATFFDANNDGLLDIATTNGWDIPFEVIDQSKFWIATSNSSFMDLSDSVQFNDEFNSAALLAFDFDQDGDMDLAQTIKGFTDERMTIRLLENKLEQNSSSNYLVVRPRMEGKNHYAIGSVVRAYYEHEVFSRLIHSGTSFYSQEPAEAFLGIGNITILDSLEIVWPGGAVSKWFDIETNRVITLTDEDAIHKPTGLKAKQVGLSVELSWNDYASNETAYILERATNSNFVDKVEIVLDANLSTYKDSDIKTNLDYYYRIKAQGENKSSDYSASVQASVFVTSLESENIDSIDIYPNPYRAGDVLTIEGIDFTDNIELFSLDGQKIVIDRVQEDNYGIRIILSDLSAGLYFMEAKGRIHKLLIIN